MPAAVSSRVHTPAKSRDALPPSKKARLSQPTGLKSLINGTPKQKLNAKTSAAKNTRNEKVQDSTAVVSGGQAGHGDVAMEDAEPELIEISSAEEESDYSSSEDEAVAGAKESVAVVNGHANGHTGPDDGTVEPEELSFGERLKEQEPESEPVRESRIVDVESAFVGANADSRELATASIRRPLAAPSATSLSTVLTQALRTNDQELLDSCLRVNDVDTIYSTIERLPSPLVGGLLQKLAERLHKRPGRPGMLMVWVQWSLATHGGYLATQTQLMKQTATLTRVLKERSSGLQPLLSLKGRLDMLQTQLELRRRNQERAVRDDMDEAVIYVEGEEEESSDDDEVDGDVALDGSRKRLRREVDDDDESSIDEMPTTMEVDEAEEEGSEDSEDLLDDEAEETDDDSGDDMSEPDDELDDEEVSESEEEVKPERRSTAARHGLSRRR